MAPIKAGRQLLHYRLTEKIGEGGMGVVWKAVDTDLDREVAIKVITEDFAGDAERLARFEREARVLAALNHPSIATIHGLHQADGVRFLAMEYVEGTNLDERLGGGALATAEALEIASQIADALATAHAKEIVHRDLKPANVVVGADGQVKVLDFGLAKIREVAGPEGSIANSPTLTAQMTQAGMILGTASYMSPEQARGNEVDKRTDVWAFGCVLLELLSGRKAFGGDTVTDVIASVVAREPAWNSLPPSTPRAIVRLLKRCLRKERDQRLGDIADARLLIQEVLQGDDDAFEPVEAAGKIRAWPWMVACGVLAVAAGTLGVLLWQERSHEPQVVRASINQPTGGTFQLDPASPGAVTISPDGTQLVYSVREADGVVRLWIRAIDEVEARPLPGTEAAGYPFWSPDGRQIGFFASAKLKRVDVTGGPTITVCDAPNMKGGTWNRDDVIVFAASHATPLSRVDAAGGTPTEITTIDRERGHNSHRHPRFLPDGRNAIYLARQTRPSETGGHSIRVVNIETGVDRELFRGDSKAEYARGHLFFVRGSALLAQPFSIDRLEADGDPVAIADIAYIPGAAVGIFSVSEPGTLVYQHGHAQVAGRSFAWTDRTGGTLGALGERGRYQSVDLSGDSRYVAVSILDEQGTDDIWILDVERDIKNRFTFDAAVDIAPVFSPDGSLIVFSSDRKGEHDLYIKPFGTGDQARLVYEDATTKIAGGWTSDGSHVVFSALGDNWDILSLPVDPPGKPIPLLTSPQKERRPTLSPDDRWLAYVSDESGRDEVYVTAYPEAGRKWQISSDGGDFPVWSGDGKTLYYVATDGSLTAVGIESTHSAVKVLEAEPLFPIVQTLFVRSYDVSADDTRFLVSRADQGEELPALTLVVNWAP